MRLEKLEVCWSQWSERCIYSVHVITLSLRDYTLNDANLAFWIKTHRAKCGHHGVGMKHSGFQAQYVGHLRQLHTMLSMHCCLLTCLWI